MIIIDMSHLSYRNLYTAIYNVKPKKDKKTGKYLTEDWFSLYAHQMLFSLSKIENKFSKYGKVVIALDSKTNWRKDFLKSSGYKGSRKKIREESEINFEEFFEENDKFIEFLRNGIGYITVQVDDVEADDIGYVLSEYINEETILVTEDKDWKQHLINNNNVSLYMPIKNVHLKNNNIQDELKEFRAIHILIGDKADDIPNVMSDIEFTPEFIQLLKRNHIEWSLPSQVQHLDIFDELVKYAEENDIQIYKKMRFGEKTAQKFIKSPTEYIRNKIKDKKKLYDNIRRNRKLVDIKKLPKHYKEKIIENYRKNINSNSNSNKILEDYINEKNLHQAKNLTLNGNDLSSIPDESLSNMFNNMFSF